MANEIPLRGYRVLDLTNNVAGPFCTMILGDLGADVIKIERPNVGDDSRTWGPPFIGNESAMFLALNRNKRSLVLDLKSQTASQDILPRLLRRVNVVVQSFRPEAARRLGLDTPTLLRNYEHLVVCDISAFGPVGPRKNEPGYDPLLQAFSGMMSITGEPNGLPVRSGTSIIDMGTGLWAAIGVISGLLQVRATGFGTSVSTSLFDTAMAWLPYQVAGYLASGILPRPMGSELQNVAPHGMYVARDGYLMIAASNEGLWRRLCEALDVPDLSDDARFCTNSQRITNRGELRVALESRLSTADVAVWLERLRVHEVPAGPVNSIAEALDDVHTKSAGIIQTCQTDNVGELSLVGFPVRFDETRPSIRIPPPTLGEHSREILKDVGFPDEFLDNVMSTGISQDALRVEGPRNGAS